MKVGVISDDLTGANATGVRLVKQGFKTATVVHNIPFPASDQYDAICIDTDSRYAKKEIAVNRVKEAIDNLKRWGAKVFCKRIDSTIRGNIGVEIDTVLNELGENSIAIVIPSFPDSGRVITGGYLLVEGTPVQETDVARDPLIPIKKSFVPAIIEEQSQYPVTHIGLDIVLSGIEAITKGLKTKLEEGKRIIVFDAVNDEQIEAIAVAMTKIHDKIMIPVDPGPLTAFYSKTYLHKMVSEQKLLVTIGSVTSLTGQQLQYLFEKTKANPVYVNPEKLASYSDTWQEEVDCSVAAGLEAIKKETILIVTTYLPGNQLINLKALSALEQVTEDALAKRITDGLAAISRKIIEQSEYPIAGCFSSGGDLTASLCAVSRANGIELEDEVLPLAAYGHFIGGYFDGLPVVTKGGMIGDKRAIYKCVRFLQTKISK